jgi:hypothetical protein
MRSLVAAYTKRLVSSPRGGVGSGNHTASPQLEFAVDGAQQVEQPFPAVCSWLVDEHDDHLVVMMADWGGQGVAVSRRQHVDCGSVIRAVADVATARWRLDRRAVSAFGLYDPAAQDWLDPSATVPDLVCRPSVSD